MLTNTRDAINSDVNSVHAGTIYHGNVIAAVIRYVDLIGIGVDAYGTGVGTHRHGCHYGVRGTLYHGHQK